jgi:phage protein D
VRDIRYQIAVDRKPDPALSDEAAEIEVQQTIEGPTNFTIKFAIDICRGDYDLIDDARLKPGTLITVTAYLNGESAVLAHGIITERKLNLVEGGAGSALEIKCQDRRLEMDREPKNKAYEGRASDVAKLILQQHKFVPDVSDTEINYSEDKTTLNQAQESDLAFINKLAGRNGMRFWIDWKVANGQTDFELTETAHFKPSPPQSANKPSASSPTTLLAPEGSAELKLNAGEGCSNVASFELHSNAEVPSQSGTIARVASDSGEVTKTQVSKPTTKALGSEATATGKARTKQLVTAGDAQEAQVRTQAAINDASWSVQATAETSVHALDAIVAPHQVLRVTGAGQLNSGDYFVKAVTHTVNSAAHKMRIELLRNALGGS